MSVPGVRSPVRRNIGPHIEDRQQVIAAAGIRMEMTMGSFVRLIQPWRKGVEVWTNYRLIIGSRKCGNVGEHVRWTT